MATSKHPSGIDRRSFIATLGIAAGGMAAGLAELAVAEQGEAAREADDLEHLAQAADREMTLRFRRILQVAGKREGMALNLDQMAFVSKYDFLLVAAPAVGLEQIDPLELSNGIDQGMFYMRSAESPKTNGFFVVRAVALREVRLGRQPVLVQLIRDGAVQTEVRGTALVWSLTVPRDAPMVQSEVGVMVDMLAGDELARGNCWVCPNGVTICVERPICGPDGVLPSEACD